jgi:hypothetical protein
MDGLLCRLLLALPLPYTAHQCALFAQDKLPQNIVDEITNALKDVRAAQEGEDAAGKEGGGGGAAFL